MRNFYPLEGRQRTDCLLTKKCSVCLCIFHQDLIAVLSLNPRYVWHMTEGPWYVFFDCRLTRVCSTEHACCIWYLYVNIDIVHHCSWFLNVILFNVDKLSFQHRKYMHVQISHFLYRPLLLFLVVSAGTSLQVPKLIRNTGDSMTSLLKDKCFILMCSGHAVFICFSITVDLFVALRLHASVFQHWCVLVSVCAY